LSSETATIPLNASFVLASAGVITLIITATWNIAMLWGRRKNGYVTKDGMTAAISTAITAQAVQAEITRNATDEKIKKVEDLVTDVRLAAARQERKGDDA
jgi:hypothetical protein